MDRAAWSFLLFWLAYAGNAVAVLVEAKALAGRGREFGLAFAAAHLVHIGLVGWLWWIRRAPVLPPGPFWFFAIGLSGPTCWRACRSARPGVGTGPLALDQASGHELHPDRLRHDFLRPDNPPRSHPI